MEFGPLEFVVLSFEGNNFHGEIATALHNAVEAGTIRIVDIIFIKRDPNGAISLLELADIDSETADAYSKEVEDVTGILSQSDIESIAEVIEPNSAALIMLFEHTWAKELRGAVLRANGKLVGGGLIPTEAVDAALEWLESESA